VAGVKVNEINQIHYESVTIVAGKAASLGRREAIEFLALLAKAGAKAYIYHEAGYAMSAVPRDFATALQLAADQQKLIQQQAGELLEAAPKIAFHDRMFTENPRLSMNEFAKILSDSNGVVIGQNKMMQFLRELGYLMVGRDATERNKPYQRYMQMGLFEVEYIKTPVGLRAQPFITSLGQKELAQLIVDKFL